jgi:hypothetical protein
MVEEIPPRLISTQSHSLNLLRLERIHRNTPYKANMNTQSAMHARATQADEDAEFGRRPLW